MKEAFIVVDTEQRKVYDSPKFIYKETCEKEPFVNHNDFDLAESTTSER